MLHASYRSRGSLYTVEQILNNDTILQDVTTATAEYTDIDIATQVSRMKESVKQGLAYHIKKDGNTIGMLYNAVENGMYEGVCVYCKNDTAGMMILMKTMFEIYDSHKITIKPYAGGLKYFVSIATAGSILKYHNGSGDIIIARKRLEEVGPKLFKYLGIEVL